MMSWRYFKQLLRMKVRGTRAQAAIVARLLIATLLELKTSFLMITLLNLLYFLCIIFEGGFV
ncbi:hypothetical protein RHMOL_Rhmol03G0211000 [Rhododendron molle]|uniref:Uncharacterized protein n=1 Tax=Rhododendron molle TaxID=49168 RepID=A0ACC0PI37_RHOML|nr:hypothetical protein RHMOL_Rhmol03G0211000 [Rhododendron molle]